MKKPQRIASALAIGLLLTLLLGGPATAEAELGHVVHPGSFDLEVLLPKRDGYSMTISAADHRHVVLSVSRGAAFVTYATLGRASSQRLDADFGALGRIAIRILPQVSPLPFPPPPGCKGKPPLLAGGRFRGVVQFNGEPGIPPVSTHHGGGVFIKRRFKQICRRGKRQHHAGRGHAGGERRLELALLRARTRSAGRVVSFEDVRLSDARLGLTISVTVGSAEERLGRVQISRSALEIGDGSELRLSKLGATPETATVSLPKPFTGTGTYSKSPPARPSWTGDLGIRLPGPGLVPLTGPHFRTKLCRGTNVEGLQACVRGGSSSPLQSRALAAMLSLRR